MEPCEIVGIIQSISNRTMYLVVPKTNITPRERVSVKIADDAFFDIRLDDLNRVQKGDKVVSFRGDTLNNGKMVIRDIRVELSPEREATTISYSDQLYLKYSKLADESVEPREERSQHFVLYTDISPRSTKVLLEKLETMHGFLARYFGTRTTEPIECFVVSNPQSFSAKIPDYALAKIEANSGLTAYRSANIRVANRARRHSTKAIVYSCDDHDVVQHEAVHAFCSMAFGQVGPVWYAEGIAEMGQYFIPGDRAIQIEPVIIEYLQTAKPKDIEAIVAANQITGDSWKAYAWRWALCHLLANNPNYSKRFCDLGINLMQDKGDSFKKAFGRQMEKLKFEYSQFVTDLDNGYRSDLCVWQWKDKTRPVRKRTSFDVEAMAGWQATSLLLEAEENYDFVCPTEKNKSGSRIDQEWSVAESSTTSADGNAAGDGKLIGVILIAPDDSAMGYELSEPFEIGKRLEQFKPKRSGHLYVRCRERWNAIADNSGELKVFIRKSPESKSR